MGELSGEVKELLIQATDSDGRTDKRVEALERLRLLARDLSQPLSLVDSDMSAFLVLIHQAVSLGETALVLCSSMISLLKENKGVSLSEECLAAAFHMLETEDTVTQELVASLLGAVELDLDSSLTLLSPNSGVLPALIAMLREDRPAVREVALDVLLAVSPSPAFLQSDLAGLIPALGQLVLQGTPEVKAKALQLLCRVTQSETNASFLKCLGVAR